VSAQNLYVVRLGPSTTSVGYIAKSAVGSVTTSLKSGTTIASVKTSGTSTAPPALSRIAPPAIPRFRQRIQHQAGHAEQGYAVTVLATEGSFYKIAANGTTGYYPKHM
jgi:hypothetical protein